MRITDKILLMAIFTVLFSVNLIPLDAHALQNGGSANGGTANGGQGGLGLGAFCAPGATCYLILGGVVGGSAQGGSSNGGLANGGTNNGNALNGGTSNYTMQRPTAQIMYSYEQDNATFNGQRGMIIHVNFNVQGMQSRHGIVGAIFFFSNLNIPVHLYSQYGSATNQLSTSGSFYPGYPNTTYSNFELFLPYSELSSALPLHIPTPLKFSIGIFDPSTSTLLTSSPWHFFTFFYPL